MSRPPRFRTKYTTTGTPLPKQKKLDYLESEFADFVERQRQLATEEIGFPAATAEGDFAGTLMELSALVGHVLGVYQDQYANEAFLRTAQSTKSIIRHGRRLGYEPSSGLSATGHIVFSVKKDLRGRIAKGFAISSSPVGEKKAQDYETLQDVDIDATLQEMVPKDKLEAIPLWGKKSFDVQGIKLGLEKGDIVVLLHPQKVSAHEVTFIAEDAARRITSLRVHPALPTHASFENTRLLAKPAQKRRLFASNTSSNDFPDAKLQLDEYPKTDPGVGEFHYGYEVSSTYDVHDIYIDGELEKRIEGPVVRVEGGKEPRAFAIAEEKSVHVAFKRVGHVEVKDDKGKMLLDTLPIVHVSRTVTAIQIKDDAGIRQLRAQQAVRTTQWLFDWKVDVALITTRPNTAAMTLPLVLDGVFDALVPGQLVALSTVDGLAPAVTEIARLSSVIVDKGKTTVTFNIVDPSGGKHEWKLGNLRVCGNVAAISHGKTITEVMGDSDGVQPFLRFILKQKPLTQLPGPRGAEPALEVRVADVRWTPVVDFEDSNAHDRHYQLQRDEKGAVTILFGDGRKGAVPSAGTNHVVAVYRVGVGRDGNADERTVNRAKKPSPLVDKVENPLPVRGGADPAVLDDIRVQATTYIGTFDRAVSLEDHQHLALRFPGVVKANAYWSTIKGTNVEGVCVVVADAEGKALVTEDVKAFLQARRDESVQLDVVKAEQVDIVLHLQIDWDPDFDPELVERAVRAALTSVSVPGLFTFAGRGLGQPAFLSEVYQCVLDVDGVRGARVWQFDLEKKAQSGVVRVVDTLVVQPHEWIALSPKNVDFSPVSEATS